MDKKKIENYLKKLIEIDKELNNEDYNPDIFNDINDIINNLDKNIKSEILKADEMGLHVNFKKLNVSAVTPSYAKDGDAGLDFTATRILSETDKQIVYGTDIVIEIPIGYVGLIFPRSSIRNTDLILSNSVGVIDSGYRGEIMFTFNKIYGFSSNKYTIGDRIGQIIILPYPKIKLIEQTTLSITERGENGHGSSGK